MLIFEKNTNLFQEFIPPFRINSIGYPTKNKLFIFSDEKILENKEVIKIKNNKNSFFIKFSNKKEKINNNYFLNKVDLDEILEIIKKEKISAIYTDIKKIANSKKLNINKIYISNKVKTKKTKQVAIFFENEDIKNTIEKKLYKYEFDSYVSGLTKNIDKFIKNDKNLFKYDKTIIINKDGSTAVFLKISGNIRIVNFEKTELLFNSINKKELKIENSLKPTILSKTNSQNNFVEIIDGKLIYKKDYISSDIFYQKLLEILSLEYNILIKNFMFNNSFFEYKQFSFDLKDEHYYELFKKALINKNQLDGIKYQDAKNNLDGTFSINTDYGEIRIFNNSNNSLNVIMNLSSNKEDSLYFFSKGIVKNIINHINQVKQQNPKLNKLKLFQTLLGFLLFTFLLFFTVNYILGTEEISESFHMIFSKQNFHHPWIYFIILNFLFSYFYSVFVAFFMEKIIFKRKKINLKTTFVYFVSSQLRKTVSFFTGNYFISMFIWGWYINKNTNVKAYSIVGGISSISIIRGIILLFVGGIFMMFGSIYLIILSVNSEGNLGNIILIFFMSIIGFAWEIIHNFWVYFLLFSSILQILFLKWTIKIRGKNDASIILETNYHNMKTLNSNKLTFKKSKDRALRVSLLVIGPIIFEALESMFFVNMMETAIIDNNQYPSGWSQHIYWNFISISGLRLMATNIHNVPIINVLPGKGLGFSEFGLKQVYALLFSVQHSMSIQDPYIQNISSQTSFATRFFNMYLPIIISFIITMWVILRTILKEKTKKGKDE
ncbi:MAG: hypothetical protein TYPL_4430 [Candidatus Tyloplasma litorale]|nr:MAG: hypothetical protein TYPL_4430 [Mycoplasmatales bacterium]